MAVFFEHLMLLSWAGRPLSKCANQLGKRLTVGLIAKAFTKLHRLQIRHRGAEARNIHCDRGPMIVDFQRAGALQSPASRFEQPRIAKPEEEARDATEARE